MLWYAEQKVIVEVDANTEDEAREIIKKNTLQAKSPFARVVKAGQQSWIVPADDYFRSRLGISE